MADSFEETQPPALLQVGGTVRSDRLYVHRPADDELLDLCRRGEYVYILTSRQMGKSSLMNRTVGRLLDDGVAAASVDINRTLENNISEERWYFSLISEILRQLGLPEDDLERGFGEHPQLSAASRFARWLENELLVGLDQQRIIIFLDEIDATLRLPFKETFFALIRSLYEGRTLRPALERLAFVLVGATTPEALISDPQRTPFNIGVSLKLSDFDVPQSLALAQALGWKDEAQTKAVIEWVHSWTGGHPFLTVKTVAGVVEEHRESWDYKRVYDVVRRLFLADETRVNERHLNYVARMITDDPAPPGTLQRYEAVFHGWRDKQANSATESWLRLSGIVLQQPDGSLCVRNKIYNEVFDSAWIARNLPPQPWWVFLSAYMRRNVNWFVPTLLLIVLFVSVLATQLLRQLNDVRARTITQQAQSLAALQASKRETAQQRDEAIMNGQEATKQREEAKQQQHEAEQRRAVADQALKENRAALAATNAFVVANLVDPTVSALLAIESLRRNPTNAAELAFLQAASRTTAPQGPELSNGANVYQVRWSPDGERLVSIDDTGTLRIWDLATRQARRVLGRLGQFRDSALYTSIAFSSDGRSVISASSRSETPAECDDAAATTRIISSDRPDGTAAFRRVRECTRQTYINVVIWDSNSGVPLWTKDVRQRVLCQSFAQVTSSSVPNKDVLQVFNLNSEASRTLHALTCESEETISPDGRLFVATTPESDFGSTFAIYTRNDTLLRRLTLPVGAHPFERTIDDSDLDHSAEEIADQRKRRLPRNMQVIWSPDSRWIVIATTSQRYLWNVDRGEVGRLFDNLQGWFASGVAWSPDGKWMAVGDNAKTFLVQLDTDAVWILRGFNPSLTWSSKGLLAAASWNGTIRFWDPATAELVPRLSEKSAKISSLAWSPSGTRLAAASDDKRIRVWNPTHLNLVNVFDSPADRDTQIGWLSDDVRILATSGHGLDAHIFSTRSKAILTSDYFDPFKPLPDGARVPLVSAITEPFSFDGQYHAAFSYTNLEWQKVPGKKHVFVIGDENRILTLGEIDNKLRDKALVTVGTRKEDNQLYASNAMYCASWNRSGLLAVGFQNGEVRLFRYDAEGPVRILLTTGSSVLSLSWSPDNVHLATGSADGTVRVWDTSTGNLVRTLPKHEGYISSLVWSPDGRRIASGDDKGFIRIWDDWKVLVDRACRIAIYRNLSRSEWTRYFGSDTPYARTCPNLPEWFGLNDGDSYLNH